MLLSVYTHIRGLEWFCYFIDDTVIRSKCNAHGLCYVLGLFFTDVFYVLRFMRYSFSDTGKHKKRNIMQK